ncbi:MAG: hypothetical protein P4N60_24540 [Verrucomicrobiae bacterium]|nr:hypothetical protein [Verrucomicrobiae bacterium]
MNEANLKEIFADVEKDEHGNLKVLCYGYMIKEIKGKKYLWPITSKEELLERVNSKGDLPPERQIRILDACLMDGPYRCLPSCPDRKCDKSFWSDQTLFCECK